MSCAASPCVLHNGVSAAAADLPLLCPDELRAFVLRLTRTGARVSALFGMPSATGHVRLVAVLSRDLHGDLVAAMADVDDRFESLTPNCAQAHWFEREIAEQWGVVPEGHPWLKPIRFHRSYRPGRDAWGRTADAQILPCVTDFFRVEGEEVHEVAVGPVHAGIIEPGHFRFQCHGEIVFTLEISLGYQHRGVERALVTGNPRRALHYAETLAGDTTIGHATAYSEVVEALSGARVPARALALRGIALELERLANHTGDLGALAGDVGYLPTMSYCGRIRGDLLNMTALVCGNRFGRGLVRPGGCGFDVDKARADELRRRLDAALRDVSEAADLLWSTPSVLSRFEGTGVLSPDTCRQIGIVGPAARASTVEVDVRYTHPSGTYQFHQIPVSTYSSGDVFARAHVRWLEIQRSAQFITEQLENLPDGPVFEASPSQREPGRVAVSLVEGWRGEICHVAMTDSEGRLVCYKIVDPSFHNWMGLALALRNQQISDFPLCNKSFNLSYCGHDL